MEKEGFQQTFEALRQEINLAEICTDAHSQISALYSLYGFCKALKMSALITDKIHHSDYDMILFCVILGKYALNSKLLSSRQSTETVESTTLWTSGMGPKT